MVHQNVISPVSVSTDWGSAMMIVPKRNGEVRICVDLNQLNVTVKRKIYPMASVNDNLTKLS